MAQQAPAAGFDGGFDRGSERIGVNKIRDVEGLGQKASVVQHGASPDKASLLYIKGRPLAQAFLQESFYLSA
jgi:hypothetical protein